ncbi:hypothetical protein [Fodinicola acaciae]|uniref:hypothetical protein n=1 Tax=Fodinicola acaciae TaxID=2681555 RepID=UPI0013CF54F6|nr:hypothetical protein [Fodinicola acaciae]
MATAILPVAAGAPASAGTVSHSVRTEATWHTSGPYLDFAECDYNRRVSASLGYGTLPCEQNPHTTQWFFLIYW